MNDPAASSARASASAARRAFGGADLPARIVASVALMALALGSAWAGGAWFASFWLASALLVWWEWDGLTGGGGAAALATGVVSLAAAAWLAAVHSPHCFTVLVIGAAGAGAAAGAAGRKPLWPGAGVLYSGTMLASVCLLRGDPAFGLRAILWLFAVVWGTDVMAYFGGRLIGGPKLWPRVSPGKTWSGFLVGVFCGAGLGALFAPAAGWIGLFALGLAGGAAAQGGDLAESAIKRCFGVKDSGRLIPGHGGIMDRLDGFIAASVLAALVGLARGGVDRIAAGVLQW